MQRTYIERLKELNDKSVWIFTKQDTNFDEAFKATCLFDEIEDIDNTNIEEYFQNNHLKYNINTDRHRILVISQLYGLITKTPFYFRAGQYKQEKTTQVFKVLRKYPIGSKEYNVIKTEQIIKLKIHAIIDTENNNYDYNILPVPFIFKVLKELKDKHGILSVKKDLLFTYVMTVSNFKMINEVVDFISQNGASYNNVNKYYDLSRVLTSINKNINLFDINSSSISINKIYEDYFENLFINTNDIQELHDEVQRDVDYARFLYFLKNYEINLIDPLSSSINNKIPPQKNIDRTMPSIDGDDERSYIDEVDAIEENTINVNVALGSHLVEPISSNQNSTGRKFKINPILGKIAIKKSGYICEHEPTHTTFLSKKTSMPFMEGHHLIPVSFQAQIWSKNNINIDCVENIVSLCPNCHRAIHYGAPKIKESMLINIFNKRIINLNNIGLSITINDLKKYYNIY